MNRGIKNITIKGFKSFRNIDHFGLNNLNVIIGANGAGKSNFIQIFHMLSAMVNKGLTEFVLQRGGADSFLFNGPKETRAIELRFDFITSLNGYNSYKAKLIPTADETFVLNEYRRCEDCNWRSYGVSSAESKTPDFKDEKGDEGYHIYDCISNWRVYHFHDTSSTSPMRRSEIIEDNKKLRSNGSNIAPFLLGLRNNCQSTYNEILDAIHLVMPFFDDFILDVIPMGESQRVKLSWKQKGSDFPMQPYHFSDGSLRFICLATALMQPDPPSTIVIDEPELGLHPAAISILAELIQVAAKKTQVIVATQSPMLIDQFCVEDIIVMSREKGASVMKRLKSKAFESWLEDYTLGELWTKNVIEGGPVNE